jgi:trk system potassium uptake protein TrkH
VGPSHGGGQGALNDVLPKPVSPKRPLHPSQLLALGFAALILVGAVFLWLPFSTAPHQRTSFLTALFTSTSAVCVTGLAVVPTNVHWTTVGQVILMVLIQMGGLGVMTVSAAVYVLLGLRIRLSQRLALQEGLNVTELSGIVRLALRILALTLSFELVGAVLLTIGFWARYHTHAVFMAVFHAVSAFNNAGFDLTGQSLVPYVQDPLVILVHAFLIIFGGLGYGVLLDLGQRLRGRRLAWTLHTQWVLMVTLFLIVVGTLLILAVDDNNPHTLGPLGLGGKILGAFFQSVTARTAGFNSVPIGAMHPVALLVLILLMFIGASPGGTGGGIKTTTFAVLVAGVVAVILQRDDIEARGWRLPWEVFARAVAIAALSLALVIIVTAGVLLFDRATFLEALFETTSAFGTVGLTMGLTPHLTSVGRILIIVTMYLGRVGPLTAAVALTRAGRNRAPLRYPEARLPIG